MDRVTMTGDVVKLEDDRVAIRVPKINPTPKVLHNTGGGTRAIVRSTEPKWIGTLPR